MSSLRNDAPSTDDGQTPDIMTVQDTAVSALIDNSPLHHDHEFPSLEAMEMDQGNDQRGPWQQAGGGRKRVRSNDSNSNPDTISSPKHDDVSLTVVFAPVDAEQKLTSLTRLKVTDALKKICPECIHEVRYNDRLNLIAVDTRNGQTTKTLLNTTVLCGIQVRPYAPPSGQTSIGVIHDVDTEVTQEELIQHIRSETKIATVRRLGVSKVVKIVFSGTRLPSHVLLGYVRHPVVAFKNRPLQCHNCGGFGHKKIACKRPKACNRCGEDHDVQSAECQSTTLKCSNCGGSHEATSRTCPKWKEEQTIVTLSKNNNIGFREARYAIVHKSAGKNTVDVLETTPKPITTATTSQALQATSRTDIQNKVSYDSILKGTVKNKKAAPNTDSAASQTSDNNKTMHQPPPHAETFQSSHTKKSPPRKDETEDSQNIDNETYGWQSIVRAAVNIAFALLAKIDASWASTISNILHTVLPLLGGW